MHVRALIDPVFQTKVAQAQSEAGSDVAAFCKRCHSPVGNMTGDPDGSSVVEAAEGVTCTFCHQVVGDTGAQANTSQLLVPNLTFRGQYDHSPAPHATASSSFLQSPEFCGGCHEVRHPTNGLVLDSTYTEWAASPYAKSGIRCQDCHMSATPGTPGPAAGKAAPFGRWRRDLFGMTFVGANVGQGPASGSTAMLKSAATVSIQAPQVVGPGEATSVTVTVTNKGAGHDLPTGLTEEREMWLSVSAVNPDGTQTKLGERHFVTVYQDAMGKHPVEIWNAVGVYKDDRIPPHGSAQSAFEFKMPPVDHTRIVATLNYRSLSDGLAARAGVANPITVMATATAPVYASGLVRFAYEIPPSTSVPLVPTTVIWVPLVVALGIVAVMLALSVVILLGHGLGGRSNPPSTPGSELPSLSPPTGDR